MREQLLRYRHFIDNRAAEPVTQQYLPVLDPSDGAVFAEIARGDANDIDVAVRAARRAFDGEPGETASGVWARIGAVERGRILHRWSDQVLAHCDELASLESRDTGKPISQARADAAALARYLEFYSGAADKLHGQTIPYQQGYTVLTMREPHGVTGHIVPWNYPMQIFGRTVGGSLAAGNACVVKPAEDACLSLLHAAELAAEAGLPAGVLNIVTGLGNEAGQALADHPGIDHISFTGSPGTGHRVAASAAARHCPVTLELGGKSAQIVFADADLEAALPVLVSSIIQNAGQTCSAGSRVLIEASVHDRLMRQLAERFSALRAGPAAADLDLGPLVSERQRGRVRDYLTAGRDARLQIAAQGRIVEDAPRGGFYQAPVLYAEVPPENRLFQEEIFGPVLVAARFDDEAEALKLANGTAFGLVAGLWTRDGARQLRLARALRCGQVFVNNYGAGGGVELPFGGVGHSGYGREKGFDALYGFTTLKTIALRHG